MKSRTVTAITALMLCTAIFVSCTNPSSKDKTADAAASVMDVTSLCNGGQIDPV